MTRFNPSELILSSTGRIYHLDLHPEEMSDLIITVGDPQRVSRVSRYLDRIDVHRTKREFVTHTGEINGKRISIMCTGMGAGNVDIWMNEVDALANIDLEAKLVKKSHKSLTILRLGTSGSLHPRVQPGDLLLNKAAIGLDAVMPYYGAVRQEAFDQFLRQHFADQVNHYWAEGCPEPFPYELPVHKTGITLTAPGFYGPQNRQLRVRYTRKLPFLDLHKFSLNGAVITNMEMETAPLYYLATIMKHRAYSMNCILANRLTGDFVPDSTKAVDKMIEGVMSRIAS